jgi:hypothetical protein
MKTLSTIFFSLIAILASLVFLLFTICAFSSAIGNDQDRHFFMGLALVALLVVIAAQWKIYLLNRKPRTGEPDPTLPPYATVPPAPIPLGSVPSTVKHLSPASQAAIQQLALTLAAKIAAEVVLGLFGWYVALGPARTPLALFKFGFLAWGLAAIAPDLILLYSLTRRPGPIAFAYSLVIPALHLLFGVTGHSVLLVLIPHSGQAAILLLSVIPWILDLLVSYLAWKIIRLTGIRPDPAHLITASVVILIYRVLFPALFVLLN